MSAASNCHLIGRWRIVEADLWDRGYLDLVDPATIKIGANGHGEIAFGAMQAGFDLGYSVSAVSLALCPPCFVFSKACTMRRRQVRANGKILASAKLPDVRRRNSRPNKCR
ncbi:hypothetical protein [Neorhizobium sp. DAR64861/K0K2]|uniref:hypothetical protein n=1 Tax=unclassified Neorhizobium TaxID=2629175 RepID=UPI003D2A7196